jgi:hypothetical protein
LEEEDAARYKFWKEMEKLAKKKATYYYNQVIHYHDLNSAEKLQYEGLGSYSSYVKGEDGVYRLNVRLPAYELSRDKKEELYAKLSITFKEDEI